MYVTDGLGTLYSPIEMHHYCRPDPCSKSNLFYRSTLNTHSVGEQGPQGAHGALQTGKSSSYNLA